VSIAFDVTFACPKAAVPCFLATGSAVSDEGWVIGLVKNQAVFCEISVEAGI